MVKSDVVNLIPCRANVITVSFISQAASAGV
jgi:hypothetical protein